MGYEEWRPGVPQSCCSACRVRREPHLSVREGNFRISTFAAEITRGEGPTSEPRRPAQPPPPGAATRSAWHAGAAGDQGVDTTRNGPPDTQTDARSSQGPDLRQRGVRADDPATTERRPETPSARSCGAARECGQAGGAGAFLPPQKVGEVGNQP